MSAAIVVISQQPNKDRSYLADTLDSPLTLYQPTGESERSTQNGSAKTLCGGGGAHTNSELPQAGFPESGEVYNTSYT